RAIPPSDPAKPAAIRLLQPLAAGTCAAARWNFRRARALNRLTERLHATESAMKKVYLAAMLALTGFAAPGAFAAEMSVAPVDFRGTGDEEAHPLNDAWLGMPVETSSGVGIGFVVDAEMGSDGDVVAIVVDVAGSAIATQRHTITIAASDARLLDTHVEI